MIVGSSTASFLSIVGNRLQANNFGDSGYLILEKTESGYQVVAKSESKQTSFNRPYQLTLDQNHQHFVTDGNLFNGHLNGIWLKDGYLVIVASDGLFDNVYEDEILNLITQLNTLDVSLISRELVKLAYENSVSSNIDTPYGQAYEKYTGQKYPTG